MIGKEFWGETFHDLDDNRRIYLDIIPEVACELPSGQELAKRMTVQMDGHMGIIFAQNSGQRTELITNSSQAG